MNIYITNNLVNFYNKYIHNYDLVKYILFNQLNIDISYITYINRYYLYIIEKRWICLNKQIINDDFEFINKNLFYNSILFEYFEKDLYYIQINNKYKITSECYKIILKLINSHKTSILIQIYNTIENICLNIDNIISNIYQVKLKKLTNIPNSYVRRDRHNVIYIITSINYDVDNCYKIGGSLCKRYVDNIIYRYNKRRVYEDKYYYKYLKYVKNHRTIKKELSKNIEKFIFIKNQHVYRINFISLVKILSELISNFDR